MSAHHRGVHTYTQMGSIMPGAGNCCTMLYSSQFHQC